MWKLLTASSTEMHVDRTLHNGQSFIWVPLHTFLIQDIPGYVPDTTGLDFPTAYVGAVKNHALLVVQANSKVYYWVLNRGTTEECPDCAVSAYFRFNVCSAHPEVSEVTSIPPLGELYEEWGHNDFLTFSRSGRLHGARVLHQPLHECVCEFICSSNNGLARITTMCQFLGKQYGTLLGTFYTLKHPDGGFDKDFKFINASDKTPLDPALKIVKSFDIYEFPTIAQLQKVTADVLRDNGFGYRAEYLAESVKLMGQPGWEERVRQSGNALVTQVTSLQNSGKDAKTVLKELNTKKADVKVPIALLEETNIAYRDIYLHAIGTTNSLMELNGVGRKVADCIRLFSLDNRDAVPIDTHVLYTFLWPHAPAAVFWMYSKMLGTANFEIVSAKICQDYALYRKNVNPVPAKLPVDQHCIWEALTKLYTSVALIGMHYIPSIRDLTGNKYDKHVSLKYGSEEAICMLQRKIVSAMPQLTTKESKTINVSKIYHAVHRFYYEMWGPQSGWAHSVLFTGQVWVPAGEESEPSTKKQKTDLLF